MDLEVLREGQVVACLDYQEGGRTVGRRVGRLEGRWADPMVVLMEDRSVGHSAVLMVVQKVGRLEAHSVDR